MYRPYYLSNLDVLFSSLIILSRFFNRIRISRLLFHSFCPKPSNSWESIQRSQNKNYFRQNILISDSERETEERFTQVLFSQVSIHLGLLLGSRAIRLSTMQTSGGRPAGSDCSFHFTSVGEHLTSVLSSFAENHLGYLDREEGPSATTMLFSFYGHPALRSLLSGGKFC